MTVIQKNLLANTLSYAYAPFIAFACFPLYVKAMGMEACGLVGFFTILYSLFAPLGAGLSTSLNRELARLSVAPDAARDMRDLLRTLEVVYWILGLVIGAAIVLASPLIARDWVQPERLTVEAVSRAVLLMGITLIFQWPYSLYAAGLNGLQRQVQLSVINILMLTIRFVGVLPVLWLTEPSVESFFIWQAASGAVHTILLAAILWRCLPAAVHPSVFRRQWLRTVRGFVGGVTGISLAALVLTQLDKVILSRMLTLEAFGYYTMATMVATGLYVIIGSVSTALSPRFAQLVGLQDKEGLKHLYHGGCQLMHVLLFAAALVGALFSREILLAWMGDPVQADQWQVVLSLLVVGTALNGMVAVPYALQLAYAWTNLTFYMTVIAAVALAPLIVILTVRYGPVGAAIAWVVVESFYMLVGVQLTHRRLMRGEFGRWCVHDVALPLAAACAVAVVAKALMPADLSRPMLVLALVAVGLAALVAAALAAPRVREALALWLRQRGGAPQDSAKAP